MNKRLLTILAMLLVVAFTPACRGQQRSNDSLVAFDEAAWTKLGQRRVRLTEDHDVIPVTFMKGRYRRIMLVVHGSAMDMHDVVVTFGNGDTFSPNTRLHFAEDSRSRVIDLPGARRTISKVELRYRSKNLLTGFAEVELWGRR